MIVDNVFDNNYVDSMDRELLSRRAQFALKQLVATADSTTGILPSVSGGGIYRPAGLQSATSYDAAKGSANWAILDTLSQQVAAAGGGYIQLPPWGIPINQALIPRSGVAYQGLQPTFIYQASTAVPDPYQMPSGGTVLIGDALMNGATGAVTSAGTFDGYAANTTALGSQPSAFANLGFTSCGMENVTFYGFRSAISIGATNNPGVFYSKFIVHAINCTDFAYKFENFIECTFEFMHSSGCVHGQRYRNSSAGLNCGNSTYGQIYNQPRVNYSAKDRGILFECTLGTEINEIVIQRVQTNSNGSRTGTSSQVVTNAASLGGGTTLIVADSTVFEQGMPVWLSFTNTQEYSSFQYNVNQGKIFWVASASGGNVQLASTFSHAMAVTNLQTFSSGAANQLYLNTKGYAGLEFNGGSNAISNFQVLQIDLELECSVAIQAESLMMSELHWFNTPVVSAVTPPALPGCHTTIAGCTSAQVQIFSQSNANYDFDNSYWRWFGAKVAATQPHFGNGNAPTGMYGGGLWLNNGQNDGAADVFGIGNDGVRFKAGINQKNSSFSATGNLNDGQNVFTGSTAGQTMTLPAPTSNSLGGIVEFSNLASVNVSVVISGGLLFNGKAALTTITMAPNSAASFRKVHNGSAYGYSIVGCAASYSAGTISGV